MISANNSIELLAKVEIENLYEKLIQQLNKDFQMSNLDVEIKSSLPPKELYKTLNDYLMHLIQKQYDDYLNFLYRVDVGETELLKVNSVDLEESINQVTFLVLKREVQKVWLRENFNKL